MYCDEMYLRTPEATRFLGVSKQTLYKMIKSGVFKTARFEDRRGWGGHPAWEIAKSELVTVKAIRQGSTAEQATEAHNVEIEEAKQKEAAQAKELRALEVQRALENVQSTLKLLSECIGDLVEKLI